MSIADRAPAPALRWIGRQRRRPLLGRPIRALARRLRSGTRVIRHGQARGMKIDPAGAHPGYALGTTEPEIQDLLAAHVRPGSVVWDVGANIGFYTLIASRLVGDGRVVAFEPAPRSCAAIARNLQLNGIANVELAPVALSGEIGTASLNIYEGSSTARLDARGRAPLEQLEVAVSTLDAQLERFPAPSVVKMDIEGAETSALEGARRLLAEVRPTIICELHRTSGAVVDLLEASGYEVRTVERPELPPREADWWGAHIVATPPAP